MVKVYNPHSLHADSMGTIPVQPCRLITFHDDSFQNKPYKPGQLEIIAREYAHKIGVQTKTEFYLGVEELQHDFGIFRSVEARQGPIMIQYEKSFPWNAVSMGVPDETDNEDRKYISHMLMQFPDHPDDTLPKLKDAFVRGPTQELLTQTIDNEQGQNFNTVVHRFVTKPVVRHGFQNFGYSVSVPEIDAADYRAHHAVRGHPYKRTLNQQLPKKCRPQPRTWLRAEDWLLASFDDVQSFLRLNEEFYRTRSSYTHSS